MEKQDFDDDDYVTILGHEFWWWGVDAIHSPHTGIEREVMVWTHQHDIQPLIIVCRDADFKGQYLHERAEAFVTIEDNPKIIVPSGATLPDGIWNQVVSWIRLNKEGLLKLWNEEICSSDFLFDYMKKI